MPRLDPASSAAFLENPDSLLGITSVSIHDSARTDTHAADGEVWHYRSGATIIQQIFDQQTGAWRSHTLS